MRVTIIDDTLRANAVSEVTDETLDEMRAAGKPIPEEKFIRRRDEDGKLHRYLLAKDRHGRQVQRTVHREHVFEGAHLENAVRRAKRFMRSDRFRREGRVPRHIALAMAAFHKSDPKGFESAMA
jgi:hypothetical protein